MIDNKRIKQIYSLGLSHKEGSERCLANRGNPNEMLFSPAIMTMTFSCEIYLKGLIEYYTRIPAPYRHELDFLFNKLSLSVRKEIIERHEKVFNFTNTLSDDKIKTMWVQHIYHTAKTGQETLSEEDFKKLFVRNRKFEVEIKELSKAFVEWRYHYDTNPPRFNFNFFRNLSKVLDEYYVEVVLPTL